MALTIKRKPGNPGNSKAQTMPPPDTSLADMAEGIKTPKDKSKPNSLPLAQYQDKTEAELIKFIEPAPEKADRATHRLNAEQLEARLVLLHRMLIRKVSPEEIRKILGISVPMYYKLKATLDIKLRLDVSKVDIPYLIGDTLALYDEVRSMALTISSSTSVKDPKVKLSAMTVALKAEENKNDFLTECGIYSTSVVEHIIRGIISTGNFKVIDGKAERMIDAAEVNQELFIRLRQYAKDRVALSTSDILGDSTTINSNEEDKCVH